MCSLYKEIYSRDAGHCRLNINLTPHYCHSAQSPPQHTHKSWAKGKLSAETKKKDAAVKREM